MAFVLPDLMQQETQQHLKRILTTLHKTLNLTKPLDLASSSEEVLGIEEHFKPYYEDVISQTPNVGLL